MKDEIKEILDRLKSLCYDDYCLEFSVDYIERKEEKLLLDYITNLQKENEINVDKYNDLFLYFEDYKSRIEKANELLQNILVVSDWEHKGRFRPVKNTSAQDVYKTIIMLNELFETPYRTNYGLLQGVGKDD